ncbi:MAG: DUF1330 domain-containing protein [Pseudomonadales bacterium]|nr:DUF1330 domain-containing protein [Pseudomonadales bacterium]
MQTSVEPSKEIIEQLQNEPSSDKAVVMLNLLRFRDQADYSDTDINGMACSGRKAYERYSKAVMPLLLEVGGSPIWMGDAQSTLIAPKGEQWDQVLLVAYPSRQAFLKMISSQAYQDIMGHRTAALLDSRLVETYPKFFPKRLVKLAGLGFRLKSLVAPAM